MIQSDEPDLVIDAIRRVTSAASAPTHETAAPLATEN
jgi:hypothetical protein